MKIGELSQLELRQRLKGSGIHFQIGPFRTHLQSALSSVAIVLRFLYQDFKLENGDELADFHVRLDRPRSMRRWVRPQVLFCLDDHSPSHPMPLRLAIPLLEWGLNWCIAEHAHQFLMFHSAVVEKAGRCLFLTAPPGSGKSTLCAALAHRGWRLFNDELALVRPEDGRAVPLPRPVGLKSQSIALIRNFSADVAMGPEWNDTHKGSVAHMRPPRDAVVRAQEAATPAWILFLSYRAGEPPNLIPVGKSRAFLRLADSAFNYGVLGLRGFEAMARLLDICDCYDFSYGNLEEAIERLARLMPPC